MITNAEKLRVECPYCKAKQDIVIDGLTEGRYLETCTKCGFVYVLTLKAAIHWETLKIEGQGKTGGQGNYSEGKTDTGTGDAESVGADTRKEGPDKTGA